MTQGLDGVSLPDSWSWSQLRHVTSVLWRGTAPSYVDDGPVRVVNQASNQPDGIDWSRIRFHDYQGNPRDLKGFLESNDIIVNSTGTGTLGRVGYFRPVNEGVFIADSHVTVVRSQECELVPRFAYYYLSSDLFQHYMFSALVSGATNQIELSPDRMGSAPVPLPPLSEQRRIADFLDAELLQLTEIVRRRNRQSTLLTERRFAALSECVSGQWLGLDMEWHEVLGNVVKSWPIQSLKSYIPDIGVGVVVNPSMYFSADGIPFIHGSNIRDGWFDLSDVKRIDPHQSAMLSRSQLRPGDVLVVRAGHPGRSAVVPSSLAGANCASVLILRKANAFVPEFVAAYFNSPQGRAQVAAAQYGAAQEQINVSDVIGFLIARPTSAQQEYLMRRLTCELDQISSITSRIDRQVMTLTERRTALITAAVTGQVDVSTAGGIYV